MHTIRTNFQPRPQKVKTKNYSFIEIQSPKHLKKHKCFKRLASHPDYFQNNSVITKFYFLKVARIVKQKKMSCNLFLNSEDKKSLCSIFNFSSLYLMPRLTFFLKKRA